MAPKRELPDVMGVLRRTRLFGGLDDAALQALADIGAVQHHLKGATIVVQDEPGDRMFVVLDGLVRIVRQSDSGDRLELVRRGVGDTFGEIALLDGGPRLATVETVQPTVLLSVPRTAMLALLQQRPTMVTPMLDVLARMVREVTSREADLAFLDLRSRLARRLLDLSSSEDPHALSRGNRVTQTELAQMVGGSRQRVHAALHALARAGHVELHETGITVLSREGLAGEVRGRPVT